MAEQLTIRVELVNGETRAYPITIEWVRAMIRENRYSLIYADHWDAEAIDNVDTADVATLAAMTLRYFAQGLRVSRRLRDEGEGGDTLFYLTDQAGDEWAIPGRSILAIGISGAPRSSSVGFRIDTGEPPEGS